jgi:hypothetical protein
LIVRFAIAFPLISSIHRESFGRDAGPKTGIVQIKIAPGPLRKM